MDSLLRTRRDLVSHLADFFNRKFREELVFHFFGLAYTLPSEAQVSNPTYEIPYHRLLSRS